ncbi:epigen [Acanthopagrus latus]|uniref:epigen n=1 Tax=Acanthopagrus latus TaxID=8177 RepID=UPI00187BEA48|nr:epigen [Acanthopagrus latus]
MFTQRQTHLENALLSAVAVLLLLLTPPGQSATLSDELQTTAAPTLSGTAPTTQPNNSSMEEPLVLRSHKPCGSEHANWCENGGTCMFPQDSDKPSCICTSSYTGHRCMFVSDLTHTLPESEQLIAISCGVAMLISVLAVIIYCCACKRCKKSAPLIKSAPSESSV